MKEIIDQLAHYVIGLIVLATPLFVPFGFVISGFLIGFIREQGQELEVNGAKAAWKFWNWGKGRWIDITFWTLAGVTLETLFQISTI
jgi:hypothetical protein